MNNGSNILGGIVCLVLFGLLAFFVTDWSTGTREQLTGQVRQMEWLPARESVSWMTDRDGNIQPVFTTTPEKFEILADVEGETVSVTTSRQQWGPLHVGSSVPLSRVRGGFTGMAYPCQVREGCR